MNMSHEVVKMDQETIAANDFTGQDGSDRNA